MKSPRTYNLRRRIVALVFILQLPFLPDLHAGEIHTAADTVSASSTFSITVTKLTGIEESNNNLPTEFKLCQNYPNPFNPATTINFTVPVETGYSADGGPSLRHVTLKVYDMLGREVAPLVNEQKSAGNHSGQFDVKTLHATSLPSGIYFYTIKAGNFFETKKMV